MALAFLPEEVVSLILGALQLLISRIEPIIILASVLINTMIHTFGHIS